MTTLRILAFLACAWRSPDELPALPAAAEPIRTVALPAGEPVQVAIRAGSAYDPAGREGLAFVTANAIADAAGARVEVGPEVVVYSTTSAQVTTLAAALASPPTPQRVAAATTLAARALAGLDCDALASRAWDIWIFLGHPYGHAPEGRLSVLPTLTTQEVIAFQERRYVRSVAVLGVPDGIEVLRAAFDTLPPRLSQSPTPAVDLPLPRERVLVVHSPEQRCLLVGHPVATGPERPRGGRAEQVAGARLDARHVAALPLDAGSVAARVGDALGGGWLPLWSTNPRATEHAPTALFEVILGFPPYPSLALPLQESDPTTAGWLDVERQRAVVVLEPDTVLESSAFSIVQPAITPWELFR